MSLKLSNKEYFDHSQMHLNFASKFLIKDFSEDYDSWWSWVAFSPVSVTFKQDWQKPGGQASFFRHAPHTHHSRHGGALCVQISGILWTLSSLPSSALSGVCHRCSMGTLESLIRQRQRHTSLVTSSMLTIGKVGNIGWDIQSENESPSIDIKFKSQCRM